MSKQRSEISVLRGVGGRILMLVLVVCLVAVTLVAVASSLRTWSGFSEASFDHLETVRTLKQHAIEELFEDAGEAIQLLVASGDVKAAQDGFELYNYEMLMGEYEDYDITGDDETLTRTYEELWATADSALGAYVDALGYADVYVLCYRHGHVMYSHNRDNDLGLNFLSGRYEDSALARAWQLALLSDEPVVVDMARYAPAGNEPSVFVASLMHDDEGEPRAVVALRISADQITEIMNERTGMGETGESYVVGEDNRLRSDTFNDPETHSVIASFAGSLEENGVDTYATRSALAGNSGVREIDGYRGNRVVSAWGWIDFGDFRWAVVAEMDRAEVLTMARSIVLTILIVNVAVLILAAIAAIIFSRSIARPIRNAAVLADRIALGDFTVQVEALARRDEIGAMNKSFREMVGSLNGLVTDVADAADQVGSGSQQVAMASQSLSQGSTEQASSLEEVSASLIQINGQANQNADTASEANALASSALEHATTGNEQVETLVSAMGRISESSAKIKKIVKVIDDIAFQINLLALNANVEAARAGKYGKGFAVVADEVRNLAVRSADAARETTVMVGETTRSVDDGSKAAQLTATQLEEIVAGASKVADFLKEIAVASRDQAEGITQINEGILQIDQVTQANTANAEQSAAASQELSTQAQHLRGLLSRFKLSDDAESGPVADETDEQREGEAPAEGGSQRAPDGDDVERESEQAGATLVDVSEDAGDGPVDPKKVIKLDDDDFGDF